MVINPTDQELFFRFSQQGDHNGYEILYKRYFSSLAKHAAWITGDVEKGKDLAQKIMIKLYEKPHLYNPKHSMKTWLFAILKNQIKNEWRNEANRKRILELISNIQVGNSESENDQNKVQSIYEALNSLSENHKEIFLLKYSNNLTINEISEILDISEGTVKSRVFYAIRAIKEFVKNNKSTKDD